MTRSSCDMRRVVTTGY